MAHSNAGASSGLAILLHAQHGARHVGGRWPKGAHGDECAQPVVNLQRASEALSAGDGAERAPNPLLPTPPTCQTDTLQVSGWCGCGWRHATACCPRRLPPAACAAAVAAACSAGAGSYCQIAELKTRVLVVRSLLRSHSGTGTTHAGHHFLAPEIQLIPPQPLCHTHTAHSAPPPTRPTAPRT